MMNVVERKVFGFVVVFFMSISMIMAQTQPNHEKKVLQDDDGTLFWNKSLPFYIRISTSKEDKDGYLLKRDSSDAADGMMYFDTEGTNWIRTRWEVDLETGETINPPKEVLWPVEADGIAPSTKATYNYVGKHEANGVIYYSGDASVDLESKDAVSGVDKIYYNTGNEWKTYSGTIKLDEEKKWTLKFYAVDRVGNVESADKGDLTSFEFIIDNTPPSTKHTTSGPNSGDAYSPRSKVALSSTDEASGVKATYYSVDNMKERPYIEEIDLSGLEDGEHVIRFYSVDNVKNKEEIISFDFYLDRIAPVVEFDIDGDQYKGKDSKLFVSQRSKITLAATDNKSGVQNIYYGIGGAEKSVYSNPIPVTQDAGYNYISYYGIDKVENKSSEKTQPYYVDTKAPVIKYSISGPNFERRDTLFVRDISGFTITPYESGTHQSGLKEVFYVDNDEPKVKYNKKFVLKKDGLHRLKMIAVDNVNNESEQSHVVFVDNVAPEIYSHHSVEKIGTKKVRDEEYVIYPKEVQVYLAATDKDAGTDKIYYSINGGDEKLYTTPIRYFKTNHNFKIDIRAIDLLGNESKSSIKFAVEE